MSLAQTPAPTAIPRTTTEIPQEEVIAIDPFEPTVVIDFREELRIFISNISSFARRVNPEFIIIAKDGLALVNKIALDDETQIFPATAYMRSLDGIMETNLLDETVTTPEGKPSPDLKAALALRNKNLSAAASSRLKMYNIEYSTEGGSVDKLYKDNVKKGFVPFVAEGPTLSSVPKFPASIHKANAKNVMTAPDIKNFLYLSNSQAFGRSSDLILALRKTNYDAVIIDIFRGRTPLTKREVELLKYKHLGSRRLVLAEIDISSASVFQYFWAQNWRQGNPAFIYAPYRTDTDRYRTAYWTPEWQTIISGTPESYIYGILDLGFDGVVLKGLDAWKFYQSGGENE